MDLKLGDVRKFVLNEKESVIGMVKEVHNGYYIVLTENGKYVRFFNNTNFIEITTVRLDAEKRNLFNLLKMKNIELLKKDEERKKLVHKVRNLETEISKLSKEISSLELNLK